jgi:carbon storage regulator CsrA
MLSGLNFFQAAGMELKDGQPGRHFIIMEVATMGVLVLTRGKLQTVVIDAGDETIEVIVAEIRGDKVKLAFSASKRVQINRPEIREKKLKSAEKDGVS